MASDPTCWPANMVDLSRAYLHDLGDEEGAKLSEFRALIPELVEKAKGESPAARAQADFGRLWGVTLLDGGDAADILLLKYLRAEELDLAKASERLAATLVWRADCQIAALVAATLPEQFRGHDTVKGKDVDGRPVLLSRFGNMDIEKVFGDEEMFVRYRTKVMEESIGQLSFERGAPEDLCQVHDYSGVPLLFQTAQVKTCVRAVTRIFAEHYPEFKGKTVFVNFPAVFSGLWKLFSNFIPARTRSKFVILGCDDFVNLFEHVGPESIPQCMGGLLPEDASCSMSAKGLVVNIPARQVFDQKALEVSEPCNVLWEFRVCVNDCDVTILFAPTDGGDEQQVWASDPENPVQASAGVISGRWSAPAAGALVFRFGNTRTWVRGRMCICRAEAKAA